MFEWLNEHFGSNFQGADLEEIKNFTLLWSLYENRIFRRHFNINDLHLKISDKNPNFAPYEIAFNYFQNRYVENGEMTWRFNYLRLEGDSINLVQQVLLGENNNPNDKIEAIGLIVYRYRNNVFHGNKNFLDLGGQQENFQHANLFLKQFLLDTKEN